ncbi:MAG: OPT/YSL family transporter [Coriobacteriia bacterium]|nr:OPT/YSL family transporter [Coriobacteriia bacterium]MCL2749509.1 OPT/YSL family transporter [Coriobacteriia bacterium]
MQTLKGQLSVRGIIIGCIGCVIITTASLYTALKAGALPWPIIFAAIISLFFLKVLGRTNLNEVNVTHTVMSAGAMTAGGLAFTIPGIWILGHADGVNWVQMLIVALSGVILGLICTVYLRRHFIEKSELEYPIGEATTQALVAGDSGGKVGFKLFGSMGLAAVFAFLRDWFGAIPAMLFGGVRVPGTAVAGLIYNSPLFFAIGFIVSTGAIVAWGAGALIGNLGVVMGGEALGMWDVDTGRQVANSLGFGLMMGCGFAVVVKVLLPAARRLGRGKNEEGREKREELREKGDFGIAGSTDASSVTSTQRPFWRRLTVGLTALMLATVALLLCFALGLGPLPSIIIVVLVWVTAAMAAQSVGQTGIDPLEIFGIIVLIIVAAFSDVSEVQLFFVAGVIAVACGLAGDLMNDFKVGHTLGTNPRAQWVGQLIGGILGAFVAVAVLTILVQAYGTGAFGSQEGEVMVFGAFQANMVASLISGIPSMPAFIVGLAAGFVLYLLRLPSMMIGLGVYLPLYLSASAFVGMLIKLVYHAVCKLRRKNLSAEAALERKKAQDETGIVVPSGIIGGESIAGVIVALIMVLSVAWS